jgi:hypothetical protein
VKDGVVYGWQQFDDERSRFTNQPVFVVTVSEPAGGDWISDAQIAEVAVEARGETDTAIHTFHASFGRGASGTAIGIAIDLAVNLSASVIVGIVVSVWRRIRHRRPIMSVGALRYLCMGDLCHRLGLDSVDDLVTVVACDTSGPRPSELNAVDIEPVIVVFADRENTRSWVYLVSPRGHVLSFHQGEAMTTGMSYYSQLPVPAIEPPVLLSDSESDAGSDGRDPRSS